MSNPLDPRTVPSALVFTVTCLLAVPSVSAQGFRWPDEPRNVSVLGPDVTGARLGAVMRGFTFALGVRCEYCHVGEPGADLSTFNFPTDDKAAKQKARVMIEMVKAVNETHLSQLSSLDEAPTTRVEVTCMTCHRGRPKPIMLEALLAEKIEAEGVDAAIAEYRELREEFYGGFAYDFSPRTLTGLGDRLSRSGNHEAALKILALEIEMNGETFGILLSLGRAQASAGMTEEAIKSFERGEVLAPERGKQFFRQQIERLKNPPPATLR
jgi:hypothetical protein